MLCTLQNNYSVDLEIIVFLFIFLFMINDQKKNARNKKGHCVITIFLHEALETALRIQVELYNDTLYTGPVS